MEHITDIDHAYSFVKSVVEMSGIYYVDKDKFVRHTRMADEAEGEPVLISIGTEKLPLKVIHSKMLVGKYVTLNPFSESLGTTGDREWLYSYLSSMTGSLLKCAMMRVMDLVRDSNDLNQEANFIASQYAKMIDDKTEKEIATLNSTSFAMIVYDRRKRTANLELFSCPEGVKLRKATIQFILNFIGDMLQVTLDGTEEENEDIRQQYTYKSNIVGCQQFDATMRVLAKSIRAMRPQLKELLDLDIEIDVIEASLDNMEVYQKLCGWYASNLARLDRPDNKVNAPWLLDKTAAPAGNSAVLPQQQTNCTPNGIPLPPGVMTQQGYGNNMALTMQPMSESQRMMRALSAQSQGNGVAGGFSGLGHGPNTKILTCN